jgi:hypothetical protein
VLARLNGKMRQFRIRVIQGDRVTVASNAREPLEIAPSVIAKPLEILLTPEGLQSVIDQLQHAPGVLHGPATPLERPLYGTTLYLAMGWLIVRPEASKKDGDSFVVEAHFDVLLSDHNIEKPCYMGVCVDDKVNVTVNFAIKN